MAKPDELSPEVAGLLVTLIAIEDQIPGKLEKDMSGEMDCLFCPDGKVRWGVAASNRHIGARCSTPGCIAFQQ